MKKIVTNVLFAMSLLITNQLLAQDQNSYYQGNMELPAEETTCGFSCTVCKYEPEYSDVYRCEYEMVPHCVKKTRYCAKTFQKRCCRYVPEYYYVTCTVQVPEYYDDVEYIQRPKWCCEKVCKMVPKYYNKPLECEPSPVCEVPNTCPQQECSYENQGNTGNHSQYNYDQNQQQQQQQSYQQYQNSSYEGYNNGHDYSGSGYQHYPETNWAAYSQQQIQGVENGNWAPADDSWKKTFSESNSKNTGSAYIPSQGQ